VDIMTVKNATQMMGGQNWLALILDWSHGGVDFSVPGNGGIECRDHVSLTKRLWETSLGVGLPLVALLLNLYWLSRKPQQPHRVGEKFEVNRTYSLTRILLLVSICFVFGIEVGYKFASRQLIFLLNPCHLISMVQMYLLAMPSNYFWWHSTLFRCMLHYLHGPTTAIFFSVTEPLVLPFEKEIYWIQHILILVIPAYMTCVDDGHGYTSHRPMELNWLLKAFLGWSVWHWIVMQGVSYLTLTNVGSMLCAATSDPFSGPDYRLIGILHQLVSIGTFGTISALFSEWSRRHYPHKLAGTSKME
jgi:hypothetical protein